MTSSRDLSQQIRRHVVRMAHRGQCSHVSSCLSVADILAVIYSTAKVDPDNPSWPDRDRVILSKGHAAAALYAALAERGFFPAATLDDHYANGSVLSGHVCHIGVPGVDLSTGSLGHGLAVGSGMALNSRRQGGLYRVFVVLSDGDCDEGSTWEAALFAGHHRLGALNVVVDYNKLQSLTTTTETLDLEPFADKWRAFGWDVTEVDGHDHNGLEAAIGYQGERPHCTIAHTIKGKGVRFMEGIVRWHYQCPSPEELEEALRDLEQPLGP